MRNAIEILKRSEKNSTVNEKARTTIERQLSHMVRLVDDLLDLSRINSDKLELQRQPVALSEVISQAVETVRPMIDEAGHELAIDLPQELMELNADTDRLSQAFANLLNNACKYKVEERKMVENSVRMQLPKARRRRRWRQVVRVSIEGWGSDNNSSCDGYDGGPSNAAL